VCSISFLIIFIINQYYSEKLGLLIWALLACFIGDLLMGLYNTYLRKQFMVIGIIAFMLGHVAFLNYMCRITDRTSVLVYVLPVIACAVLLGLKKISRLHMGSLLVPCVIYCYFVSTMTLKAIECGLNGSPILGFAGVLFLLSDFTILYLYFYHFNRRSHKRFVHYINLSTYYMAILLFIYSM
jgi:uncharacterized membrane protein YhhN